MKKLLIWAMMLMGTLLCACTSDEDSKNEPGSIYGIVTELGTAEPMKAIGIELYKKEYQYSSEYTMLILKTVTFDDGHFEFKDLNPDNYQVKVVADGYEQTEEGFVAVEAGRQARIDLQVRKQDVHAKAYTANAVVSGSQITLNGEYTVDSYSTVSEAGFVYATNKNPQNGGTLVKCKKDEIEKVNLAYIMSTTISNLSRGTYYYQAYVTTQYGTAYGEIFSFKVSVYPEVKTLAATNVLAETATLNGLIVSEGDPAYTERGFVYSKSYSVPTVDDPVNATTKVPVSGRSKDFSANVSSLIENATYYVRAYATNEDGTFYGEVKTFVPSAPLPSVVTLETTNILETSATLNGRIESPGDPAYTEKGFLYSESHETPTMSDSRTSTPKVVVDGTSRDFEASISSLKIGTTYYVRAYATSSKGTSYGEVKSFTTIDTRDYVVVEGLAVQKQDLGKGNWFTANDMCKASKVGGFSDWRLPTISELAILYTHKNEIGGFKNSWYWSSTLVSAGSNSYYDLNFSDGKQDYDYPTAYQWYVRAVRTVK